MQLGKGDIVKKKNKFFALIFALFLLFIFPLGASAATYNAYGSVTSTSSQAAILIGYYLNSSYFSNTYEFIVMRTGQYDYKLFSGPKLSGDQIHVISYIRGSDNEYHITENDISSFSYNLGNYSAVGNVDGTLVSFDFQNVTTSRILYFSLLFIIIISLFSLFRVKEHKYV